MIHLRMTCAVVLVLGLFVTVAGAAEFPAFGQSSDDPIRISSKKASARNVPGGKEATYEGKVSVTQGKLSLECDKLVIVYDEENPKTRSNDPKKLPRELETVSNIKSISAMGKVVVRQEDSLATAGKAVYDHTKRTITLTDGPKLWHGKDQIVADTITYYLDENRTDITSGGDNMIRTFIHPKKPPQEKDKEK